MGIRDKTTSTWTHCCLPVQILKTLPPTIQTHLSISIHRHTYTHKQPIISVCVCMCPCVPCLCVCLCSCVRIYLYVYLYVHACLHVWLKVALSASAPILSSPQLRSNELLPGADQGLERPRGGWPANFLLHRPHFQVNWKSVMDLFF